MSSSPQKNTHAKEITSALIAWYEKAHRALPWREDPSPYHVWLSEIMLQQTRVEAVRGYYLRFLAELPDIAHLAKASEDTLLKLWEGLGYYSRVRNLQKAARILMEEHDGRLPEEVNELRRLPGIGPYTAGAVSSIAFHKRAAAVDGNVLRVMARLLADGRDIAADDTKRAVHALITNEYLPADDALCGTFNQALMELGAVVCLPNGAPDCVHCPVSAYCAAHRAHREEDYPVKSPKKERRIEQRTVLLLCDRTRIALTKRPPAGLLAGLYEYPSAKGHLTENEVRALLRTTRIKALRILSLPDARHLFTHVEWRMKGYLVYIEEVSDEAKGVKALVTLGKKILPKENGTVFLADRADVTQKYAIPSASRTYTGIVKTLLPGEN